ncbi:MAG: hypothetical protein COX79_02230 [Candidatus Levybacteria bacterium CG_4_10_14_0_2_um_filter_36_16]|nr:MAG: hypothetical protein AUK12_00745 [Candidatus Levybacteria bacterium CG2_30_37_29]PIR78846.1 MAG: hypothetical protein COU26_04460 [Candidatus Levybacteria bacterium CG10_big_fil_rev_8_21_14_0_10_36_30]PIZ97440.1 MAG: hypothetical protein COX79_02230 [Candidatus Levybacteria bacterium CG_4_10_14_0_2_um_filter_36_16]
MYNLFGGDFRFFWPENIGEFVHLPSAWDSILNTGIGTSYISLLWINTYLSLTALTSKLGLSWSTISIMFWILPVFIFSFSFTFLLFAYLFPRYKIYGLLAGIIYAANTYIFMVVLGIL